MRIHLAGILVFCCSSVCCIAQAASQTAPAAFTITAPNVLSHWNKIVPERLPSKSLRNGTGAGLCYPSGLAGEDRCRTNTARFCYIKGTLSGEEKCDAAALVQLKPLTLEPGNPFKSLDSVTPPLNSHFTVLRENK